jgi:hypothetical protein
VLIETAPTPEGRNSNAERGHGRGNPERPDGGLKSRTLDSDELERVLRLVPDVAERY